MILKSLSELTWREYQNGKGSVKDQTFRQLDIEQKLKLSVANEFRVQFYASKRENQFNEPDYSFFSPLLTIQKFPLPEADNMFRFPGNMHVPNVYPVGEGCGNQEVGEITQVKPAEENFYINDTDMETFQFYVVKGRGLDTYHIPPCIKELEVESTFLTDETDISMDIAYTASTNVLSEILGVGDKTGEWQKRLKEALAKQEVLK
jgi:hypothetical protein